MTDNEGNLCKFLKGLVGACGFEPQPPAWNLNFLIADRLL